MSSLQDKLYGFEAPPPPEAWKNIAGALDEAPANPLFPSRLHDMEVAPPAAVWEAIAGSLDGHKATEEHRPATRILPFFRYAAAAVLIGLVAFSIFRITGLRTTTRGSALVTPAADSGHTGKNALTQSPGQAPPETTMVNGDISLEQSKKMIAKLDRPARSHSRKLMATVSRTYMDPEGGFSAPEYIYDEEVPDMADRYIQLMTPDGNLIRMSKKWSNLLCCVSGEEQDEGCKDQLKKWQQMMADSPINPSAGNFIDLLNLVNSLDDEL